MNYSKKTTLTNDSTKITIPITITEPVNTYSPNRMPLNLLVDLI